MVDELGVTETLVFLSLVWHEVTLHWTGQSVKRNRHILRVADLLQFNMRHLLVVHVRWVVSWNVTRKFWEV